jgi:hypothetical protein
MLLPPSCQVIGADEAATWHDVAICLYQNLSPAEQEELSQVRGLPLLNQFLPIPKHSACVLPRVQTCSIRLW